MVGPAGDIDSGNMRRALLPSGVMSESTRYVLPEERIPERWYNIQADMLDPPAPLLHPGTEEPI